MSRPLCLPWTGNATPHASLELLRGCNLACPGCYNATAEFRPKPLDQLRAELDQIMRHRRLHTVTLTGGEPLLHPSVEDVIRHVRGLGLRTVLLSNGVLFDASRARRLRDAGLDMIVLHIQERQDRPDLPSASGREALRLCRLEKTGAAASAGLDVGFSALLYPDPDGEAEIRCLLAEVTASDHVHFLLVCPQGDFSRFSGMSGTLREGYRLDACHGPFKSTHAETTKRAATLFRLLREASFGLFAAVGASDNNADPRWSVWHAGVLAYPGGGTILPIVPAWTDWFLLRLPRLLTGRHWFHMPPSAGRFRLQLALSLLGAGLTHSAGKLLAGSLRHDARLFRKHVVVELPPVLQSDGRITICRECPDATIRDGRLVPPCLADRLASP